MVYGKRMEKITETLTMNKKFRLLSTLLFALCLILPASAKDDNPEFDVNKAYKKFIQLYNTDQEKEFYEVGEQLLEFYRNEDRLEEYYKTELNICLYDVSRSKAMKALERANEMLKQMEEDQFNAYSQVYMALGTIYEDRGNYRMARHFYEEGINSLAENDEGTKIAVYSRIAYLMMLNNPVEAEYWNKKYYKESLNFPPYHQVFLFINGMINFAVNNDHGFRNAYKAYISYHEEHPDLDNYGLKTLDIAMLAFNKQYDEALIMVDTVQNNDINTIGAYDMRTQIYKMMGRYDLALENAQKRADCVDSLNSDMLFTNLNEINAQTGVAWAHTMAAKDHSRMFYIILTMSIIIIGMLTFLVMRFRKNREELSQKNEQLNSALAMAEEGERMKTEFVRSVSHEIRTPLNAINGFNELLNTPGLTLSEEDRTDLLNRIKDNIQAITNIVDEMLRVADKESNEFDSKSDELYCNQFFSNLLYSYRNKVNSSIELKYTTRVINRFQIISNEKGLRKIMDQLIHNAIKFTSKGFIEVHCEENGDMINISVTDTGKGISEEQQEKIFEGFYKIDAFQQGIGLGLTVSKKIAQKLGGDLVLDTSYKDGARFVLTMPVS